MKVLFIAHRIPYPPNKGEKIRAYHILRYLAERGHEIHLATLVDSKRDLKYVRRPDLPHKTFAFSYINAPIKKMACLGAFLLKRPVSCCYFYAKDLQRAIDAIIEDSRPDCVFCSSSPTAEYVFRSKAFKAMRGRTFLLMDLIDVDSKKWLEYAEKTRPPFNLIYKLEGRFLRHYEKKVIESFDCILLTSTREVELLSGGPYPNVHVMGNGVDTRFFSPDHVSSLPRPKGPVLVFTGAMDYHPNVDGVLWFVRSIYPSVRKNFKDCTFYIVGGNPAPAIKALHGRDGIVVTGFVEDVRDYLAIADVCVAPLRIARGIQNKVLEAMAMGRPVVATCEAAGGIEAESGTAIFEAQDEKAFFEAVDYLLSNPKKAKALGQEARDLIEKSYTWPKRLAILDGMLSP